MARVDRILLVTGSSRGIGAATARLAASRGYDVCVNYRSNGDAANAVVTAIRATGRRGIAVQADVSVESDVVRLFKRIDAELGDVSALVNNAATIEQQSRIENMTADRIDRVLGTNVKGPFFCAREAIRRMSTLRGGHGGQIVNVSSRAAQLGSAGEYVDYAASKAALETFTIGLAAEVAGEGIRVNGVRLGIINTEIHATAGEPGRADRLSGAIPIRRPGTVDEVAHAIVWILSSETPASGTFVDVTGGW